MELLTEKLNSWGCLHRRIENKMLTLAMAMVAFGSAKWHHAERGFSNNACSQVGYTVGTHEAHQCGREWAGCDVCGLCCRPALAQSHTMRAGFQTVLMVRFGVLRKRKCAPVDEGGGGEARQELGVAQHVLQKKDVGLYAADVELVQRALHALHGLQVRAVPHDHLRSIACRSLAFFSRHWWPTDTCHLLIWSTNWAVVSHKRLASLQAALRSTECRPCGTWRSLICHAKCSASMHAPVMHARKGGVSRL